MDGISLGEAEAIQMLEVSREDVDPCANGHVQHGPDDHYGRSLVHSISPRGFGADWDYDEVVKFIQHAPMIRRTRSGTMAHVTGHGLAVFGDGRWMAFATRGEHETQHEDDH